MVTKTLYLRQISAEYVDIYKTHREQIETVPGTLIKSTSRSLPDSYAPEAYLIRAPGSNMLFYIKYRRTDKWLIDEIIVHTTLSIGTTPLRIKYCSVMGLLNILI